MKIPFKKQKITSKSNLSCIILYKFPTIIKPQERRAKIKNFMGQNTGASGKGKKEEEMKKETVEEEEEVEEGGEEEGEHDEQDGMSVHSPCKPPSSALRKEQSQVELEIRLLEALEIYPPAKLRGIHRHFVLYGLTEYLRRSFNRQFAPDDVLKLLDRFYNLEMVKPDDEDAELLNQEEEFSLPESYFSKEES